MKGPREPRHVELLSNPLSAEFGVRTQTELQHLIAQELSSFKLGRSSSNFVEDGDSENGEQEEEEEEEEEEGELREEGDEGGGGGREEAGYLLEKGSPREEESR
eukprot:jgi/Undpi1/8350/HiC_scaffold_25.g10818.m1